MGAGNRRGRGVERALGRGENGGNKSNKRGEFSSDRSGCNRSLFGSDLMRWCWTGLL